MFIYVYFSWEKYRLFIRNSIQIKDLGSVICTFCEKSTKIAAHSPTLKVGFAAEAILQVADVFAVTDKHNCFFFSAKCYHMFIIGTM